MSPIPIWRTALVFAGVAIVLAAPGVGRAADPAGKPEKAAAPAAGAQGAGATEKREPLKAPLTAAAMREALARMPGPAYVETPLQDVADHFSAKLGFPVSIDRKAFDDVGIGSDTPVTFHSAGLSGNEALNRILREHDLTWVAKDGVLLITTPEAAEVMLETVVYDVTDLVLRAEGTREEIADFVPLVDMIVSVIQPSTWDAVGGPGAVVPFQAVGIHVLVVSQTQSVHGEIERVLKDVRAMRHGPVPGGKAGPGVKQGEPTKATLPQSAIPRQSSPAEKAICAALEKPVTIEFSNTPWPKVAERWEKVAGVPLRLDKELLAGRKGLIPDPKEEVAFVASNMKLRAALDRFCRDRELDWTVDDGMLVILLPEDAPLVTRVYDVGDLAAWRNEWGEGVPDFDVLLDFICSSISPTSWKDVAGPGSIGTVDAPGVKTLVVSNTWKTQEEIAALLEQLRSARKGPVTEAELARLPLAPPRAERDNPQDGLPEDRAELPAPPPLDPDARRDALVHGNNQFACDLYRRLRQKQDNLFFSPSSLSIALGMVYAGARGETAKEMAETLHFTMPPEETAAAFQTLLAVLPQSRPGGCRLSVASRLWGQAGYPFRESFLTCTRERFGAELAQVDFRRPEDAARQINAWAAEKTAGTIREVVSPASFTPDYRLVVTNAVYFLGQWSQPFEKYATQPASFHCADQDRRVALMYQQAVCRYGEVEDLQVLEKTYRGGDLAMMILLPPSGADKLDALERSLSPEELERQASRLEEREVKVYLPRFELETTYSLNGAMSSLGISLAFEPKVADLSGIQGGVEPFWLAEVRQRATLKVDEAGTEAAAVTFLGGMGGMAAPPPRIPVFRADHPFVFLIRDRRTGSILFLGRLTQPSQPAPMSFGPYSLPPQRDEK
jgi:serpin B